MNPKEANLPVYMFKCTALHPMWCLDLNACLISKFISQYACNKCLDIVIYDQYKDKLTFFGPICTCAELKINCELILKLYYDKDGNATRQCKGRLSNTKQSHVWDSVNSNQYSRCQRRSLMLEAGNPTHFEPLPRNDSTAGLIWRRFWSVKMASFVFWDVVGNMLTLPNLVLLLKKDCG